VSFNSRDNRAILMGLERAQGLSEREGAIGVLVSTGERAA